MNVDTSISHHFPAKQGSVSLAGFGMLAFGAFAIWVLVFDGFADSRREQGAILVSWLIVGTFPVFLVGLTRRIRDRKLPLIEISSAGLLDRRSLRAPVAWDNISGISTEKRGPFMNRYDVLICKIRRLEELRSRQHPDQNLMNIPQILGKRKLVIDSISLQCSFATLEAVTSAFWKKYNSSNAASSAMQSEQ